MNQSFPSISLKAARVNAGLTQDEAGRFLNRTKQTIVNWENGVTEIKYRDLEALSELYGKIKWRWIKHGYASAVWMAQLEAQK